LFVAYAGGYQGVMDAACVPRDLSGQSGTGASRTGAGAVVAAPDGTATTAF